MGRRKQRGRDVHGILLLDKPLGITSNAALQQVKRLYFAKKAGHTGSLDPLASGLLPICLGEATKLSSFLLDSDKAYEGTCQLGVKTTTGDAEGDVLETRPVPVLDEKKIKQVMESFLGRQEQIPPMHSAVKVDGKPLYKLAHQGIEVERKPREVEIYSLELLELNEDSFRFTMRCSKGTYVRVLVEDIGEALGCGAHLSALRRTAVGHFSLDDAVSMEKLEQLKADKDHAAMDDLLMPLEMALQDWPAVRLSDNSAYYVRQGQAVLVSQAPTSGWVRLFAADECFLGVGQVLDDGRVAPKRLVNTG